MRRLLFFVAVCAWAQLEMPSIGVMLDASGARRVVYGVPGNLTLGPPVEAEELALPANVFANDEGIELRRADASVVRFALPGIKLLRAMSREWVQVITDSGNYAVRIEPGKEAVAVLPAAGAERVRRR